jgi:hypothetical protein
MKHAVGESSREENWPPQDFLATRNPSATKEPEEADTSPTYP